MSTVAEAPMGPPELEGYTFVRPIATGGFSHVFLYEQEFPRRPVAVKAMHASAGTRRGRAAFVAEANLMARISAHPYIVTIFHADVAPDGRPFLVMEYCSGPSLAQRYRESPIGLPEVLQTGIRVASAVATAHAGGILHGDIKPANVLTTDLGWPALTDFGISSVLGSDEMSLAATRTAFAGAASSSASGSSVGLSIPWSPPEMFEDVPKPDARSDVFSLAATVYTILEGHTPFEVPGERNRALDLMRRIDGGEITPFARTDIPESLMSTLRRGMAVSPDDRFASASDFAMSLQDVEGELSLPRTPIEIAGRRAATTDLGVAPALPTADVAPLAMAEGTDATILRDSRRTGEAADQAAPGTPSAAPTPFLPGAPPTQRTTGAARQSSRALWWVFSIAGVTLASCAIVLVVWLWGWSASALTPGIPLNPSIESSSLTAPADLVLSWDAPDGASESELTYSWEYTSGSGESGFGPESSVSSSPQPPGVYQFRVRACKAADLCGGWGNSATVEIMFPEASAVMSIVGEEADPDGGRSFNQLLLEVAGFGPSTEVTVGYVAAANEAGDSAEPFLWNDNTQGQITATEWINEFGSAQLGPDTLPSLYLGADRPWLYFTVSGTDPSGDPVEMRTNAVYVGP
jgi:serine/threonine protein kinase